MDIKHVELISPSIPFSCQQKPWQVTKATSGPGPSQFPCFEYALVSPCSVSQECRRGRWSQRPGRSPPQAELPKAVRLPPPRVFV